MQRTIARRMVGAAVLFATAFCVAITAAIAYGAFHQNLPLEWSGMAYVWLVLWPLLFALCLWHDVTGVSVHKLLQRFRPYLWS